MKAQWHNDSEAYLLFGKELNKIIAALQYLSDRNPNTQSLNRFIDKLINMRSYDQMLDEMIFKSTDRLRKDPPKDSGLKNSMSLDEILYRCELKLPEDKNGKN
tara:strand:+ start:81 stop:389 length:309 start_codon:yes stop_codon:yes gene_type:complete